MLRILFAVIFIVSALYGLQSSKPVIIRNEINEIIRIENLFPLPRNCLTVKGTWRIKNIIYHDKMNYISLITFIKDNGEIISVATNFYKLKDPDNLQINNKLAKGEKYTIIYSECPDTMRKYILNEIILTT